MKSKSRYLHRGQTQCMSQAIEDWPWRTRWHFQMGIFKKRASPIGIASERSCQRRNKHVCGVGVWGSWGGCREEGGVRRLWWGMGGLVVVLVGGCGDDDEGG